VDVQFVVLRRHLIPRWHSPISTDIAIGLALIRFLCGMLFYREESSMRSLGLGRRVLRTVISDFFALGGIFSIWRPTVSATAGLISLRLNHNAKFDVLVWVASDLWII
jgi:hypothetical protein